MHLACARRGCFGTQATIHVRINEHLINRQDSLRVLRDVVKQFAKVKLQREALSGVGELLKSSRGGTKFVQRMISRPIGIAVLAQR